MLRTLLSVVLLVSAFSAPAPAAQQLDARASLERSRDAVAALKSASYKVTSERRMAGGNGQAETAQGVVRFERLATEDAVGSKLSMDGKFDGKGPGGADLTFKLSYDGELVRGILGEDPVLWRGTAKSAEDILMFGEALMVRGLTSADLLAQDAGAETVTFGEKTEVGGVEVMAIECQHGEPGRFRKAVWYVGTEDYLPRQIVADYHLRGMALTEVQQITELIANPEIYAALFSLQAPAGFKVQDYVSPRQQAGPALLPVGSAAPEFELLDPSGATHKLSDYRGKLVVIDFWATWCPPCRRAMPLVQKLHERFADNDSVRVFGISTAERGTADPAEYMRKEGYTYGLLLNGEKIGRDFMAASLPTFYVIGKDGKVLYAAAGFEADLDKTIGDLLEAQL